MSRYKIWWQSSTAIAGFPDYQGAIELHAKKVLSSDVELTVRGVESGTSELHFMAFEFLNNAQLFDSVTRAEREGYDAVALGCFFDPILDELREVMDIPVMGMAEVGMLTACMLGKRFSVVAQLPQYKNKHISRLAHEYGLSERATPIVNFDVTLTDMLNGFKNARPCIEGFEKAGMEAVKQGAEVLLPGCGIMNMILVNNKVMSVGNATVLDTSGALMKMTEMMVILGEVSGMKISRAGYYEAPPKEMLEEVSKIYGR